MRIGLYKKRFDKRIFIFAVAAAVFYLCFLFFERVYPNYISRIDIYLNNAGNAAINRALSETMKTVNYENFENKSLDAEGKITAVSEDTYAMNLFKAQYTDTLYKIVNQTPPGYITMPLGSLSKIEFLSGIGPKMRIKSQIDGIIKCDFKDIFESCGINQVKHKIYLDVSVTFYAMSATMNRSKTVSTTVPVCETVISGVVPRYYGMNTPFFC